MSRTEPKSIKTSKEFIDLHYNSEGQVRLTFKDSNIICLAVDQALDACRAYTDKEDFRSQFEDLIETLGKWLSEDKSLSEAYLTTRDGGLLFLVIRPNAEFSRDFEDRLTELDILIANDERFDSIQMSVLSLPRSEDVHSIRSFLARMRIYGSDQK